MKDISIILIEDDEIWRDILTDCIRDAYPVIKLEIKSTFKDGWAELKTKNQWNLLVTDIALPGLSEKMGINLVKKARKLHIPTVVVSGSLVLGAQDVRDLIKLYDVEDLFSKNKFDSERFIEIVKKIVNGEGKASYIPDRNQLLNILEHLLPITFEKVIFTYQIPTEYISNTNTPQAQRAMELIRYAESRNELAELQKIITTLNP